MVFFSFSFLVLRSLDPPNVTLSLSPLRGERSLFRSLLLTLAFTSMARRLAEAAFVLPLSRCLSGGGPAAAARQATANAIFGAVGHCRPPRPPPGLFSARSLLALFPSSPSSSLSLPFSSSASVASPSSSSSSTSWPPLSKIPRWWGEEEGEEEGGSSSSSAGSGRRHRAGPRAAKLSALPFSVSRADAERTYRAFHAAHALLPSRPPTPIRVDEAFLPFWAVAAVGTVRLQGAAVGFDRRERVYDPLSRTWRSEVRTQWHTVSLNRSWEVEYLPDAPGMCVYASFRYAASDADAASPARGAGGATLRQGGVSVAEAVSRPAPPDDVDDEFSSSPSSSSSSQRAVDPFEMPPAEAVRVALAAARASEVERAAAALRHEFRADRVAAVDLTFDPLNDGSSGGVAASPLYAPAFVFIWEHYGVRVATVVSGSARGEVAGDRALDAARVAAAAAVASVAAMAVAGGPPAWLAGGIGGGGVLFGGMGSAAANALGWALGLAGPAAAAALAAHYAPLLRARLSAAAAARGAARSAAAAKEKGWDAEWVETGASAAAEAARRRSERGRRRRQGSSSRPSSSSDEPHRPGPAGDPRRYYSTLGVAPTASQREVSAAFRGAALRKHPDRLPPEASDAERAAASKGFRELVEAYSVLRDPGKRKAYDRGEI